jgi:hypothetical protein
MRTTALVARCDLEALPAQNRLHQVIDSMSERSLALVVGAWQSFINALPAKPPVLFDSAERGLY